MKRVRRVKRAKVVKRKPRAKGRLVVGDDGCWMLAPRKKKR
jgi:hypothetical protein